MKFLKSKLFIACAIVAAILVLVPALLAAFGQVDILKSGLKTIAKPFEWCAAKAADAVDGFISVFTDYDALVEENKQLKATIESMQNDDADIDTLKKENAWLKEYLALRGESPDLVLADAKIISHEAGNYSTVLTLNKGSVHGIKTNMPVITSSGLLGSVSEVGLNWCKVVSIVETSSKVGVYTDRTGVIGTVEGSLELRQQGQCLMSYGSDADIKVGDRVYTSGTGSIYPYGLLIGRIVSIEADETTRRLMAVVQPAVDIMDMSELDGVMVICGYKAGD